MGFREKIGPRPSEIAEWGLSFSLLPHITVSGRPGAAAFDSRAETNP